jgi:hypothetical protein
VRLLVAVALVVPILAAGCGSRDSAPPASGPPTVEAEAPPAPESPARPLLGEECAATLERTSDRLAELDDELERERAARREARARIERSQATLEGARDAVDESRRRVRTAERRAQQAGEALREFRAEHGTTLAPPLYARWEELRDAYEAARAEYERRHAAHREAVLRHGRLVDEHNRLVAELNRAIEALNARGREHGELHREWRRTLEGCVEETERLPEHQAAYVAELERVLAEPATGIAGREATAHCAGSAGWPERDGEERVLGYVRQGESRIHLAPEVCHALHVLLHLESPPELECLEHSRTDDRRRCPPDVELLVRSLSTVAHEAQHVAGVVDEAEAECYGLQEAHRVGERLGLEPRTAHLAAWYAWSFPQTPPDYQSPECRPGGALDRRPEGAARWP